MSSTPTFPPFPWLIPPADATQQRTPEMVRLDVINAMRAHSGPSLFVQDGHLVYFDRGSDRITRFTEYSLLGFLGSIVVIATPQARTARWEDVDKDTRRTILATAEQYFPTLRGVMGTPYLSPSKRIVDTFGYDAETQLFLKWDGMAPLVEVGDALWQSTIERLLDFPFAASEDRAHALGLYLLPFVRPAIAGATPFHLITAPRSGNGKTYLAECVGVAGYGRILSNSPIASWSAEVERQMSAYIVTSPDVLFFDNIESGTTVGGPDLHRLLTTYGPTTIRPTRSGAVTCDVRCVWIATGNLIEIDGDMERRTVPITLVHDRAAREHITPDLRGWIAENRSTVVACMLASIRRWVERGCPLPPGDLGSFNHWNAIVGGIVTSLSDAEVDVGALWLAPGHRPISREARDATTLFEHWPPQLDGTFSWLSASDVLKMHDNLNLHIVEGFNPRSAQTKMGGWLKMVQRTGRIYARLTLDMHQDRNGTRYRPAYTIDQPDANGVAVPSEQANADLRNVRNLSFRGSASNRDVAG